MKNNVKTVVLNELRRRVELVAGFPVVTKKDCGLLSDLIARKLGRRVSETTIYRLFVSVDENHTFYASTLGVLAAFVEFDSWRVFEWNVLKNADNLAHRFPNTSFEADLSIWDVIFRNKAWNMVDEFLTGMGQSPREDGLHALGWIIYSALKKNPEVETDFYDHFCTNALVRKAFFEFAAHPDMDLIHYNYGMEKYIQGINSSSLDLQLRDYLFAHSLMARRDFVRKDFSDVVKRFETYLNGFDFDEVAKKISPIYPIARFIESKWLYLFCQGDQTGIEKLKKQVLMWIDQVWNDLSLSEQKAVVFCVLESVHLTQDKSQYLNVLVTQLKAFFISICGKHKDLQIDRVLERMEFNGLRLQIRQRESVWN